jgi:uncharacterized protein
MRFGFYILICLIFLSSLLFSQNIGQHGDTIINYIDINGNKQGHWEKKYRNGNIAYKADFKNNKVIGEYKRYYESGPVKSIIKYDKYGNKGKVVFFWDDGTKMAVGNYVNQNVKDSIWLYYATDGILIMLESYKNGKKDGISKKFWRNGKPSQEVPWENDMVNGAYREFYESGKTLVETGYKKGVNDGLFFRYYESNRIAIKGFYKNNMEEGKWQYFDSKGNLLYEIEYKNGVPVNEKQLNEEFKKQMKEWDRNKGKFSEPNDKMFFPD